MNLDEAEIASRLRSAVVDREPPGGLAREFASRLGEVAAHPDRVPIELDGAKAEARLGGTVLAAAMKNRVRLMHVCGARVICTTCRVRVDGGEENLTPMTWKERFALRSRFAFGAATRLGCHARIRGPVELRSVFPLCGNLPAGTAAIAWTARLRVTSFLVTLGLTLFEFAAIGGLLGAVLWLADLGAPGPIATWMAALAAVYSLSIGVGTHVRPPFSPLSNGGRDRSSGGG